MGNTADLLTCISVFYTVERREISPQLVFLPQPPPLTFQAKFISTCSNISATSLPEVTRSNLREPEVKNFPGRAYPKTPPLSYRSSMLHMIDSFPSLAKKSYMKPCISHVCYILEQTLLKYIFNNAAVCRYAPPRTF